LISALSNPPNIKHLAIPRPSRGPCRLKMGGQCGLKKSIPGFQDSESLMFLSKNLLFRTLGSQITKE